MKKFNHYYKEYDILLEWCLFEENGKYFPVDIEVTTNNKKVDHFIASLFEFMGEAGEDYLWSMLDECEEYCEYISQHSPVEE